MEKTAASSSPPDTTWSREHVWPVSFGLDTSNVDPGFSNADAEADSTDLEVGSTPSESLGRFANLSTLLKWHEDDPVSLEEQKMNQLIYSTYQRNRNPFIDQPEYVPMIWESVLISKADAAVTEGGNGDTYTLVLTGQPIANVSIAITTLPASQVIASPSTILFTPLNWSQAQTITLRAVNDSIFEKPLVATLFHSITSTDVNYSSLFPSSISVAVTDNDPLIAPTSPPIDFGGPWSPLPAGFLGTGLGTYTSSLGGDTRAGSARFDHTGDRPMIALSTAPSSISYWLDGNPASGSTATEGFFLVQESVDGVTFTLVNTVTNKNNAAQGYTLKLLPNSRFIAFIYQTKVSGNIQLDKLSITDSTWLAWQSSFGLSGPDAAAGLYFDKDGQVNLAEYALGGSPLVSDSASIAPLHEKLADRSVITATVRIDDPALTTVLETSTDLASPGSWTTSGVVKILPTSQTGVAAGFERQVFEINQAGAPMRFFRFRFHLN